MRWLHRTVDDVGLAPAPTTVSFHRTCVPQAGPQQKATIDNLKLKPVVLLATAASDNASLKQVVLPDIGPYAADTCTFCVGGLNKDLFCNS